MAEGFFRSATPQEHEAVVKNEEKQKKMLDTFGSTNTGVMGIPETEKKKK